MEKIKDYGDKFSYKNVKINIFYKPTNSFIPNNNNNITKDINAEIKVDAKAILFKKNKTRDENKILSNAHSEILPINSTVYDYIDDSIEKIDNSESKISLQNSYIIRIILKNLLGIISLKNSKIMYANSFIFYEKTSYKKPM